jgi:hypothetical protein
MRRANWGKCQVLAVKAPLSETIPCRVKLSDSISRPNGGWKLSPNILFNTDHRDRHCRHLAT